MNEGYHAKIEYTTKPLEIEAFIKGKCFICNQATPDKEAYCHYECANAYEKKRKEFIDDFFKKKKKEIDEKRNI